MPKKKLISVKNINKSFLLGKRRNNVLKDINLDIYSGQLTNIFGPSGCGKSTLLNVILGIEKPDRGIVKIHDEDLWKKNTDEQADIRKREIGIVYQQQNWVRSLTVIENVALSAQLLGFGKAESLQRAQEVLKEVGMFKFRNFYTSELSSGEQQRVGLARALIADPEIILADEPTGNLDTENGDEVVKILKSLAKKGKAVVLVSHNPEYLDTSDTIVIMKDGYIIDSLKQQEGIVKKVRTILAQTELNNEEKIFENARSKPNISQPYYPTETLFEKIKVYSRLIYSFFYKSLLLFVISALTIFNPTKAEEFRKKATVTGENNIPILDLTELSFKNLFFKKFRTVVTILGVGLGTGFVVLLLSLGYGMERLVIDQITAAEDLSQVDIFPKVGSQLELTDALIEKIAGISGIDTIYRIKNFPGRIDYKGSTVDVVVYGVEFEYLENSSVRKVAGEFLEEESDKYSAIVNKEYVDLLGLLGDDVLGERLDLSVIQSMPQEDSEPQNILVQVLGVVEDDSPPVVYLKMGSVRDYTSDEYSELAIVVNRDVSLEVVRKQIESLGLETFSVMDTIEQVQNIFTYVRYGLLGFGVLAFAIAFLGMINTLVVSLLERTREVGLLKIIGMKRNDIRFLFIIESMFIGLLGGITGVILGVLGGYLVSILIYLFSMSRGVEFMIISSFPLLMMILVVFCTTMLGFFTGLYPANRAVKIPPLDAIRYE
jgi:putative ABC transport system permease protein